MGTDSGTEVVFTRNLLQETLEALERGGRGPEEVLWAGTDLKSAGWAEFAEIARGIDYLAFGGRGFFVDPNAVVAGDGWWLERRGVGRSERWVYREAVRRPEAGGLAAVDLESGWVRCGGYGAECARLEDPDVRVGGGGSGNGGGSGSGNGNGNGRGGSGNGGGNGNGGGRQW
ncbi:MAG: hypothetical protein LBT40_02420 [Deltaproteobacteria bacterium]|jgi:hypothetical protein|nr:hypothetical protein [Deltaproteobacteria bacterium]